MTRRPRPAPSASRIGQLLLPRQRSRQQQVADVRARDEQDEADGRDQQQQRLLGVADDGVPHRLREVQRAAILLRELALELLRQRRELGLGPLEGHVRAAGARRRRSSRTCARPARWPGTRCGTITSVCSAGGKRNPRGSTPTTSRRVGAELNRARQHVRIGSELRLPQLVADDRPPAPPPRVTSSGPKTRPCATCTPSAAKNAGVTLTPSTRSGSPFTTSVDWKRAVARERLERLLPRREIDEIAHRDVRLRQAGGDVAMLHEDQRDRRRETAAAAAARLRRRRRARCWRRCRA